jgi:alkylation response protein AidB-like acyl-CoA dehydrogenase
VEHCRRTTLDGRRLIDDPRICAQLVRIYTHAQVTRVFGLRNFWLSREGTQSYEGSQASYLRKVHKMRMTRLIAEIAGPAGMLWSGPAPAGGGALARTAAGAIGSSHGGGTIDIQRVVMARRLGIGRAQGQSGANLG